MMHSYSNNCFYLVCVMTTCYDKKVIVFIICDPGNALVGFKWVRTMITLKSLFLLVSLRK